MLRSKRLGAVEQLQAASSNAPAMGLGAKGDGVSTLQGLLSDLGYTLKNSFKSGKADGIYGGETDAAVKAFQVKNGLVGDGVAGAKTLALLDGLVLADPLYERPDRAGIAHAEHADRTRPILSRVKASW